MISRVTETKYLALHIDEYLNSNSHVSNLRKNLVKYFGIFKKIRDSIDIKLARQLYFAFIFSRVNYGIQIYGTCAKTLLDKIQILSNRLLKFLLKLDFMTPTSILHKNLNILTVSDLANMNIINFVSNCISGECPTVFKNYYTYPAHRYPTRALKLNIPPHKTTLASSTIKVKGVQLWDRLPNCIKDKYRLKSFRNIVKKYYLSMY